MVAARQAASARSVATDWAVAAHPAAGYPVAAGWDPPAATSVPARPAAGAAARWAPVVTAGYLGPVTAASRAGRGPTAGAA